MEDSRDHLFKLKLREPSQRMLREIANDHDRRESSWLTTQPLTARTPYARCNEL